MKRQLSPPLVSILCITYNQSKFISEAIESFLKQETSFSYEICIGDDGSTDGTREICRKYADENPHKIRLFERDRAHVWYIDGKPSGRLNFIETFNECKGEYIAICEGDDFWSDTQKLELQIAAMRRNKNVMICFHSAIYVSANIGESKNKIGWYGDDERIFSSHEVAKLGGAMMPSASLLIKREVNESMVGFFIRNKLPAGDVFIQYFGSDPEGALYLPRVMSVYRVGYEGSWTELQQRPRKQSAITNELEAYTKSTSDPVWLYCNKEGVQRIHAVLKCRLISQAAKNGYYYLSARIMLSVAMSDFPILINFIYGSIINRLKDKIAKIKYLDLQD